MFNSTRIINFILAVKPWKASETDQGNLVFKIHNTINTVENWFKKIKINKIENIYDQLLRNIKINLQLLQKDKMILT